MRNSSVLGIRLGRGDTVVNKLYGGYMKNDKYASERENNSMREGLGGDLFRLGITASLSVDVTVGSAWPEG